MAKKYLLLREELRTLEVSAWMETLDKLAGQTKAIKESYAQAQTDLEKARAQVTENYRYTESISERMREKDLETETLRERLAAAESDIAEYSSAGAGLETDQKNNQARIRRM